MQFADPLSLFLPPVQTWFRTTLGEPTPVQRLGWPKIAAGENTLLLAPTGSGKTLAAFLACLDGLWRQPDLPRGVRVLYISPLKALNNDIHRNLQAPLHGVAQAALAMDFPLPMLEAAVRTGDTPPEERQRLIRRPPHILITTPESLHLLLTSKARETLRSVTHVIVDEIHALCPNKRGVFLALLLERLEAIAAPKSFVRIGLSATQRPLEEVARFLGGATIDAQDVATPRPVAIIDAGLRKNLDLKVVSPVEQFGPLPERTIWPSIIRLLAREIENHRSTIVFANNRRTVERVTTLLNEELEPESPPLARGGLAATQVKAHHGSVSLEMRQQTEQALKVGELRAVVATASLELGIDMGAVDLVCQVESPGSVARGLQRVGRAGHLVGQQSKGRLIPKTLPDLLNQAVLAAEMAAGRVEPISVPQNCLDVLAQQIIAMVAMEPWNVSDLYRLVRQSRPYHALAPQAFESVLEMATGRFRFGAADESNLNPATALTALQPRISWDRVHHTLNSLPGSQKLALLSGGTIPDTGQYAVVTRGSVPLGEVDEEFVYERRIGDVFMLGTNAWRIDRIDTDRVHVLPAEGAPAMIPFWRGEQTGRSWDLGVAQGRFLADLRERLDDADCLTWLQDQFFVDGPAAHNLRQFVRRQLARTKALPTDRAIVIEASRDPLGDWQVIVLTPLGSRFHLTLKLALESALRERLGYRPQCLHHDDGVLIRLTDSDEPVLDVFEGITTDNLKQRILDELADSALFALRFRQNAARALLMPRGPAHKRAPLWLQRLRGRDLLQVARRHPDFPIVVETFRECLQDHLDLPRALAWLEELRAGTIEVSTNRLDAPSPFAASLLFNFTAANMYVYNVVDAEPGQSAAGLDQHMLDQLIGVTPGGVALDPRAIQQVENRLRGVGLAPRSKAEMAEWLRRLGDVTDEELGSTQRGFVRELAGEGVAQQITLAGVAQPERWILTEESERYQQAFGMDVELASQQAAAILQRFLETHALVSLSDVLQRYPFESTWAEKQLSGWAGKGRLVVVAPRDEEPPRWSARENFAQVQRSTLGILRREVITCPSWQFADFVARWQKLHSSNRVDGSDGVAELFAQFQALAIPVELWEEVVLPARMEVYQSRWLDELLGGGAWLWVGQGSGERGIDSLAFLPRDTLDVATPFVLDEPNNPTQRSEKAQKSESVHQALQERGAQFVTDLAQTLNCPPGALRSGLWDLVRRGLATNDRFDVVRRGEQAPVADAVTTDSVRFSMLGPGRTARRPRSRTPREGMPEGRWSLIPWQRPDLETQAFTAARLLLQRYGLACRELALLDERMPAWRILYEVLSRLELVGEVRRGYFVEGLSGAQFMLPEAAKLLQDLALPSHSREPMLLVHSLDPANLYGSAAPFDIDDDVPRQLLRRAGNWLVVRAGKPVLIVEQQGKRLTTVGSLQPDELVQAVACLPRILKSHSRRDLRHRLTVEAWNGQPVTATEGKELLEAAGFVRDYQAMTLYGVWS